MTTSKFIAIAGLILTLAFPSALLAGSVNGTDWYSEEQGEATNRLERVIPSNPAVARSGIGVDWYYDGGEVTFVKHGIDDHSFSRNTKAGIGMDWHSGEKPGPANSGTECIPTVATVNTGANNC